MKSLTMLSIFYNITWLGIMVKHWVFRLGKPENILKPQTSKNEMRTAEILVPDKPYYFLCQMTVQKADKG